MFVYFSQEKGMIRRNTENKAEKRVDIIRRGEKNGEDQSMDWEKGEKQKKDKLTKMLLHFMVGNTKRYILSVLFVSFPPRKLQCPGKCGSRPPGKQPERQLFRRIDADIRKDNDLIFHLTD